MKVLALTRYSRLGASSRLRFFQYLPDLAEDGIEVKVSALFSDAYLKRLYAARGRSSLLVSWAYLVRILTLLKVRQFDLLWIEKELFPGLPSWAERLISFLGVRYVVDFDDAIFHNYDSPSSLWGRFLSRKIDEVMRRANVVVAGNSYIAQRARVAGARHVEIIPTVVDLVRYKPRASLTRASIVVGWVGSPSTVKYLEQIAPVLARMVGFMPFVLRVVGAKFAWPGISVELVEWQESTESDCIQQFDIGVMPLTDSEWERGKCGYKLIQYMACGLPVVASAVGVNVEIVKAGVNGYLASSEKEWEDAFSRLARDSDLRRQLGSAGRHDVEERYCLNAVAPQLSLILNAATAGNTRSD